MYAIIETGGKQLKVEVGQKIYVEKLHEEVGSTYTFDKVLMVSGDKLSVGNPYLAGAKVVAKVEKQGLGKKIHIYKIRRKGDCPPSRHIRRSHKTINQCSMSLEEVTFPRKIPP